MVKNKKILITGADGFIGSHLCELLIKKKFNVIGIDKEKSNNKKVFQCNILNTRKFNSIIKKEKTNLDKYYFEYFITQVGAAPFRGSGVSVKKGSNNTGNDGMAYRVYGCGVNTGSPTLIVTLESLVILPK